MRWLVLAALLIGAVGCSKKDDYSIKGLNRKLDSTNPATRYEAARKLGKQGAKDAVPKLTEMLEDPDATVRMGAAYALADIGPDADSAVSALQQALKDKDRGVSEAAAYALKQIQPKKKK